ncbi:MAG: hypothetical protein ACRYFR_03620 [Janthinobacterium lividum]
MRLQLLQRIPCLTIYYDSFNNWLFLDWKGSVALPDVQAACLAVARCYLLRPYARVLNNYAPGVGVGGREAAWLAREFLPYLSLAGALHVAWVLSPVRPDHSRGQTVADGLSGPTVACFPYLEEAMAWLGQLGPAHAFESTAPRSPARQTQLEQTVHKLAQKIGAPVLA